MLPVRGPRAPQVSTRGPDKLFSFASMQLMPPMLAALVEAGVDNVAITAR